MQNAAIQNRFSAVYFMLGRAMSNPRLSYEHEVKWPWYRILAVAVCFILLWFLIWFAMLYPLTPSSLVGWAIEFISGVIVYLIGWGSVSAISWLERRERFRTFFSAVSYVVASALGIGIFAAAYMGKEFLMQNFTYFFHSAL